MKTDYFFLVHKNEKVEDKNLPFFKLFSQNLSTLEGKYSISMFIKDFLKEGISTHWMNIKKIQKMNAIYTIIARAAFQLGKDPEEMIRESARIWAPFLMSSILILSVEDKKMLVDGVRFLIPVIKEELPDEAEELVANLVSQLFRFLLKENESEKSSNTLNTFFTTIQKNLPFLFKSEFRKFLDTILDEIKETFPDHYEKIVANLVGELSLFISQEELMNFLEEVFKPRDNELYRNLLAQYSDKMRSIPENKQTFRMFLFGSPSTSDMQKEKRDRLEKTYDQSSLQDLRALISRFVCINDHLKEESRYLALAAAVKQEGSEENHVQENREQKEYAINMTT